MEKILTEQSFFNLFDKCINLSFSEKSTNFSVDFFCRSYCRYLQCKDSPTKASMFITSFENLLNNESCNLPEFCDLYNDLKNGGVLHQNFIQNNPSFSEDLHDHWQNTVSKHTQNNNIDIQSLTNNMKSGLDSKNSYSRMMLINVIYYLKLYDMNLVEQSVDYLHKHRKAIPADDLLMIKAHQEFYTLLYYFENTELFSRTQLNLLDIIAEHAEIIFDDPNIYYPKINNLLINNFLGHSNKDVITKSLLILSHINVVCLVDDDIDKLISILDSKEGDHNKHILTILHKITTIENSIYYILPYYASLVDYLKTVKNTIDGANQALLYEILNILDLHNAKALIKTGDRLLSPLTLNEAQTLYEGVLSRDKFCAEAKNGLEHISKILNEYNNTFSIFSDATQKVTLFSLSAQSDSTSRDLSPFKSLDTSEKNNSCETPVNKKRKANNAHNDTNWANNWECLFKSNVNENNDEQSEQDKNANKMPRKH